VQHYQCQMPKILSNFKQLKNQVSFKLLRNTKRELKSIRECRIEEKRAYLNNKNDKLKYIYFIIITLKWTQKQVYKFGDHMQIYL